MAPTPPLAHRTGRDAALAYAQRGWHVFPLHSIINQSCTCHRNCDHPAKHPITRGGLHDATTNPRDIRAWFDRWPWCNVAIATGALSNLVVVDIDTPKGGQRSIDTNPLMGSLPETLTGLTGGGGLHLLYTHPGGQIRNTAGHLPGVDSPLAGVDLRGDGGYIVAPPSRHASGHSYRWRDPSVAPAPAPPWLRPTDPAPRTIARAARSEAGVGDSRYGLAALSRELDHLAGAVPGQRNAALNRSAFALGTLVAGGELEAGRVHADLLAAAVALGLPEAEAEATIASGLDAGAREPRSRPPTSPAPRRPGSPSAAAQGNQQQHPMGGDSDGIRAAPNDRKELDMARHDGPEESRTSHPRLEENPFTLGLDWQSDRSGGSSVDLGGGYQATVASIGAEGGSDLYRWAIIRPPAGSRDTPLVLADGTMPSAEAGRQAAETVLWSVWGAPDTASAAAYLASHTEFTARVVVDGPLAANRAAGDEYLAAHPKLADRVAAHGRELAKQYGIESPGDRGTSPEDTGTHLTDAEVLANLSQLGFPEGRFALRRFDDNGNQLPPDGTAGTVEPSVSTEGLGLTEPGAFLSASSAEPVVMPQWDGPRDPRADQPVRLLLCWWEHEHRTYQQPVMTDAQASHRAWVIRNYDGAEPDYMIVDPEDLPKLGYADRGPRVSGSLAPAAAKQEPSPTDPGQGSSPAALAQTAYPVRLSVVSPAVPGQTRPTAAASQPETRHR